MDIADTFKTKKELSEKVKILDTKNLYTLSFNLVTKKNSSSESQEKNKRLLKSLLQAIDFINTNPAQAKKIVMTSLDLQKDFIDWVWQDYIYSLSLNHSLLLTLEDEARWAIKSGLTTQTTIPDYQAFIDSKALSEVDNRAVAF